jgi:hypothetical protein
MTFLTICSSRKVSVCQLLLLLPPQRLVEAVAFMLGRRRSCWLLLLRWRQLVQVAAFMLVVVVAAAADCCGGDSPVQLLKTINWSGVIVTKGEFIVVSYRLMLHDFSNDLLSRKVSVCQLLLLLLRPWWPCWWLLLRLDAATGGGVDCGLLRRQWLVLQLLCRCYCCCWRGSSDSLLW